MQSRPKTKKVPRRVLRQASGENLRGKRHSGRVYVASWCLMVHFVTRSAKYQRV